MSTILNRDPFSRSETIRVTVPSRARKSCDWCGSKEGKFSYGVQTDGLRHRPSMTYRTGTEQRVLAGFCSVSCWRAYTL